MQGFIFMSMVSQAHAQKLSLQSKAVSFALCKAGLWRLERSRLFIAHLLVQAFWMSQVHVTLGYLLLCSRLAFWANACWPLAISCRALHSECCETIPDKGVNRPPACEVTSSSQMYASALLLCNPSEVVIIAI